MTDYTPSDAAKDYVGGMFDEPSAWAPIIVAAFDAGIAHERESRKPRTITTATELDALGDWMVCASDGSLMRSGECTSAFAIRYAPLTLLVPASESAPEPVRLTDANDERIKPGARVRIVRQGAIGADPGDDVSVDWIMSLIRNPHRWRGMPEVYLLAAAPDSDDDVLDALASVFDVASTQYLADLRAAGYDVVKRVDQ